MNKHCTNSSCRKTFSTLVNGGICPFCGKVYPQLVPMGYSCRKMEIRIDEKRISFKMDEVEHYLRSRQIIKGIKSIMKEFERHGYSLNLRSAREFYTSLENRQIRMNRWREVSDPETGKREIVPVYPSAGHRFYIRSKRYAHIAGEILCSCKGDGDLFYGLTKKCLVIDQSERYSFVALYTITNVRLIDLPDQKGGKGSKCLQITFCNPNEGCSRKMINLAGGASELNKFAQCLKKRVKSAQCLKKQVQAGPG